VQIVLKSYLVILSISIFLFFGCRNETHFEYDYKRLIKAWDVGDSLYLKNWILNLDTSDFGNFSNRVSEFANETNFCYGNIDVEGDVNSRWNKNEQEIMKHNVKVVFQTYLKSCLFLNKKIIADSTMNIANKYWKESRFLTHNDINNLNKDFQKLCK
jgi:hypothetical protein